MPTTNPRVNVTLSPSLDALVVRLAALDRISKSQVLRELLEAAEPALQRAVALMEAAKTARVESRAELRRGLDRSQAKLEAELEANLHLIAHHSRDLVSEAQAVRGRRPARAGRQQAERADPPGSAPAQSAKNPPASNRGVKSTKSGGSRATKGSRQ
jgi:hypothetical protein